VLPDLREDVDTGVRGLPHRLGARAIALTGSAITASAVILFGPGGTPGGWRWVGFVAAVLVAGTAAATA
jgi:hypothetical protein